MLVLAGVLPPRKSGLLAGRAGGGLDRARPTVLAVAPGPARAALVLLLAAGLADQVHALRIPFVRRKPRPGTGPRVRWAIQDLNL